MQNDRHIRDTKKVAEKLFAALNRDKRNEAKHFAESIPDKQRRRKLEAELAQILGLRL